MIGFPGLTVLLEADRSAAFASARRIAQRQASCSEWIEENGRRLLRVTYSFAELAAFQELVRAVPGLEGKRLFVNGLEVRWPDARNGYDFYEQLRSLADPQADPEENPVQLLTRYPMHLELQH